MTKPIEHVAACASSEQIEEILLADGVVIIDQLNTEAFVEHILDEVSPWFNRTETAQGEWLGLKTRRLHGLLAKRPPASARTSSIHSFLM